MQFQQLHRGLCLVLFSIIFPIKCVTSRYFAGTGRWHVCPFYACAWFLFLPLHSRACVLYRPHVTGRVQPAPSKSRHKLKICHTLCSWAFTAFLLPTWDRAITRVCIILVLIFFYFSSNYDFYSPLLLQRVTLLYSVFRIMYTLKMAVFRVVAPRSLVDLYRRFRGAFCFCHQEVIDVMMEAAGISETSVNFFQTIRRNVQLRVVVILLCYTV
jgi:hypothetical protein